MIGQRQPRFELTDVGPDGVGCKAKGAVARLGTRVTACTMKATVVCVNCSASSARQVLVYEEINDVISQEITVLK